MIFSKFVCILLSTQKNTSVLIGREHRDTRDISYFHMWKYDRVFFKGTGKRELKNQNKTVEISILSKEKKDWGF